MFFLIKKIFKKNFRFLLIFLIFIFLTNINFIFLIRNKKNLNTEIKNENKNIAKAIYQYTPSGGQLITGTELAPDNNNMRGWRALLGNDSVGNGSGNYWIVQRVNPGGLDLQFWFDGVELYGANKIIITIEDSNITTGDVYIHQICDWVSSTGVNNAASGNCTGGGWRTLHARRLNYNSTSDTVRQYEIYNGYFSTRDISPGSIINTPLSNFINPTNKRVLLRVFSTVNSTTQFRIDAASLEVAIDPFYEPSNIVLTSSGATTNFISDLVGAVTTNVNASDGNKLVIPMPSANNPIDFYLVFNNVKTYPTMNTILAVPEICVSNSALTFNIFLRDFQNNDWTPLFTSNQTGSVCGTDTEYGYAFNNITVTGFNFSNYISSSGEIWIRFLTNAPATVYNMQLDRVYIMLGSVNTDSSACEISWGVGTASNCANTRDMREGIAATPVTPTFQVTTELEYPTKVGGYYGLDNDDDGTNGEAAYSANIDFPIQLATGTAVTAVHYAVKYRSNNTSITVDLQMRNYSGNHAHFGSSVASTGSGWDNTPGTDTNAATTYSYFDTWRTTENQFNPEDYIDTVNNRANLRLRTSASSLTTSATWDWDFAMMSIRWVEEQKPVSSIVSCSTNVTSTSFGNILTGSVFTSSPNVSSTISCSGTSAGCTLYVKDIGDGSNPGLYKSNNPTYLILSSDSTLNGSSDGYGIQAATTTAGSGGVLNLNPKYSVTGNTVGGLTLTNTILASSTIDVSGREVIIIHKASVGSTALSGSYSDTITYSCIAN